MKQTTLDVGIPPETWQERLHRLMREQDRDNFLRYMRKKYGYLNRRKK